MDHRHLFTKELFKLSENNNINLKLYFDFHFMNHLIVPEYDLIVEEKERFASNYFRSKRVGK